MKKFCKGCKRHKEENLFSDDIQYSYCKICIERMLKEKEWKDKNSPKKQKTKKQKAWKQERNRSPQSLSENRKLLFGKYKGWEVQHLPQDYLDWFILQENVPDTIRKEFNRRNRTSKT